MLRIEILLPALAIFVLWLGILTFLYVKSVRHYKRLKVGDGDSLENAMDTVFKGLGQLNEGIVESKKRVESLENTIATHVQKVALLRFNPFGDTGGDQSFSLAMLNAQNDGVVLSSLHGRSGTRIYAKPIKSGKPDVYELSTEEQEAINMALRSF